MKTTRFVAAALLMAALTTAAACSTEYRTVAPPRSTTSTPATAAAPVARPTTTVDQLVGVGDDGGRLHLTCSGSGATTILLIAGFESAGGQSWATVVPQLSATTRVCTYDRYGTGTSDAPTQDQTFTMQAADLHRLLDIAGEPGPYVVAGHSFGGAEAVAFASRYEDEVDGLLLVDTSPVVWPTAACAVPDDGSAGAAGFVETCTRITHADQNVERLDGAAAFAEVAAIDSLGDLPMAVLTRADVSYPDLAPDVAAQLASTWHDGQSRWASLSSTSEVVPVEDTGHLIQIEQPTVVLDHLAALLAGQR